MLFNKPTVPVPIEKWFSNPDAVDRLRVIVNDPYFQLACATLLAASLPTRASTMDPQRNVQLHSWLAGYGDFISDLNKLSRTPPRTRAEIQEWEHIAPPPINA